MWWPTQPCCAAEPILPTARAPAVASSRVERFRAGEQINWQIGEMIGAGAFGRVYLGLNNDTGQLMAVKQVCLLPVNLVYDVTQDEQVGWCALVCTVPFASAELLMQAVFTCS